MAVNTAVYKEILQELSSRNVQLVAVSKTKPIDDILELYQLGQRDFGENYVHELVEKADQLPKDIRWHFIGHLQSNKVKQIIPFVHLIHGVDSLKLLNEINKQAGKNNQVVNCLLQVYIASEETKYGLDLEELDEIFKEIEKNTLNSVNISGLMGMASFTDNQQVVRQEFQTLFTLFKEKKKTNSHSFSILSIGMSGDYKIAVEEGSTMVRIGSLLFGERAKK